MKQEEKQLLLQDLSTRLPYGVKVYGNYQYSDGEKIIDDKKVEVLDLSKLYWFLNGIKIKPYLRPMSSMTEEEGLELSRLTDDKFKFYLYTNKPNIICYEKYDYLEGLKILDWLNAHHFDYRGLIGKGLALEAPDGMYNI